ncbi:hypothetical protein EDD18DRAFT_1082657, partial [Armillaria luteobubalina]
DGLSLTQEQKDDNIKAKEDNGQICFDPDIVRACSLTDGIHIFMNNWGTCAKPAERCTPDPLLDDEQITISVTYTDGSAYNNGTADPCASAGVWFGDDNDRNIHVRLPGPNQMNNVAEIHAMLERVLAAINNKEIVMISDSTYVI